MLNNNVDICMAITPLCPCYCVVYCVFYGDLCLCAFVFLYYPVQAPGGLLCRVF